MRERLAAAVVGKVFLVHCRESTKETKLKLTVLEKALHKPFGTKVVEPALKAINAKLAEAQRSQIALDDLEKVVISHGGQVFDLSVSVASLIPANHEPNESIRVDLVPRIQRAKPIATEHAWHDEAEALYRVTRDQAVGFALQYPRIRVEDGVRGRAGGGERGAEAVARIAAASAGISEYAFEIYPSEDDPSADAPTDERRRQHSRAILWIPSESTLRDGTTAAARGLPPRGLPLVMLAHDGLSHARAPHTLWLAWRLVRQHGCAVVAVDHLPHHGVRCPDGASSCDEWPAADLGPGDHLHPWSSSEWEKTLRRAAVELGYALDIVLALPASLIDHDGQNWLQKLADRSRMHLTQSVDGDVNKMIDRDQVGFVGFGYGTTSAIPFLAADATGSAHIRAAVLGLAGDVFPAEACIAERTTGGLHVPTMGVPGTHPSPPAAAFRARIQGWARNVSVPVHFFARERDERAPVARCRALFDALGGPQPSRRWQLLPGAQQMTVADLSASLDWLMRQLAAAPPRPRPPPTAPKPTARPVVRGAGATPSIAARPSARDAELEQRSNASTEAAEDVAGARAAEDVVRARAAAASAAPRSRMPEGAGRHTDAVRSLEARMHAAREEAAFERARRAGPPRHQLGASPGRLPEAPSRVPSRVSSAALASARSAHVDAGDDGVVDLVDTGADGANDLEADHECDGEEEEDDEEVRGMDSLMAMVDAQRIARGGPKVCTAARASLL